MITSSKNKALLFKDTITQMVYDSSDNLIASSWDGVSISLII